MSAVDIAVIGGGASGLMAAICAKEENGGMRVAVLERFERVGRKLLATGNGRCNLTNLRAREGGYHGDADFAMRVIAETPPESVLALFGKLGLRAYADEEGRVYPLCGQASAVLDALRLALAERGAETLCGFDVSAVDGRAGNFAIRSRDGRALSAARVIVCAGSLAAPQLGGTDAGARLLRAAGHRLIPMRPALSQLLTPPEHVRALKGLRFSGAVRLIVGGQTRGEEEGEILFTDSGLSGIAVMQLARGAGEALLNGESAEVSLRLLPDEPRDLEKELSNRALSFEEREAAEFTTGLVSKRIGQLLMKRAGIQPLSRLCGDLRGSELRALSLLLTDWRVPVIGVNGFDGAQVAAGGIALSGFDSRDMQSRIVPGLYAAGEVLNVDGDCGGYNLNWAWASGALAGRSAAASLRGREQDVRL